jgi:hypothetical protein
LLKIEPGNTSDELRCSLTIVDLDKGPKYTALSYSWEKDQAWTSRGLDELKSRLGDKNLAWNAAKAIEKARVESRADQEEESRTI